MTLFFPIIPSPMMGGKSPPGKTASIHSRAVFRSGSPERFILPLSPPACPTDNGHSALRCRGLEFWNWGVGLYWGHGDFCYNSATKLWISISYTTFVEIAKHGSFSRAGQKVFRSQPAVSAQIRQLEQEYGEKLFDRGRKSVRLTSAGEALFEYACAGSNLRQESLRAVADKATTPRGMLTMGSQRSDLPVRAAGNLRGVPAPLSGVQISIYRNFSHKVLQKVEDGTVDVGIVTLPVKSPSLKVHSIFRDRVMLMVNPRNPLAKIKTVRRGHCRAAADFPQDRLHAPVAGQAVSPLQVAAADHDGTDQRGHDQALRRGGTGRFTDQRQLRAQRSSRGRSETDPHRQLKSGVNWVG